MITIMSSIIGIVFIAVMAGLCAAGIKWGVGPFGELRQKRLECNSAAYAVEKVKELENSPLKGKNILFLGSSVTYGAASLGTSFVEYVCKRGGASFTKEAVSGTTLVNNDETSYIARLKKLDTTVRYDFFVCQLSTNDATKKYELAEIRKAVTDIIDYARETWNCPIIFYTNSYYNSAEYAAMVEMIKDVEKEYHIMVFDLYTDKAFNDLTGKQRRLYMDDDIHPTRAGYLLWWTPKLEEYFSMSAAEQKK